MIHNNIEILHSANRILVLAPHPDDETLGCGGTLVQFVRSGKEVCVMVLSKGDAVNVEKQNIVDVRREESRMAAEILGIKQLMFMDFPDSRLDQYHDEIRGSIMNAIRDFGPDIVFAPSPIDVHEDHIVVSKIIRDLLREMRSFRVAFYEIYSPIRYNCIVDITDAMERKERAVLCYNYSLLGKPGIMLAAIKGLNAYRSFAYFTEGYFEVFHVITADDKEEDILEWLTYGLNRETSAYQFLKSFKKTDQLLLDYQDALARIDTLNAKMGEREAEIEGLRLRCNDAENKDLPAGKEKRWWFMGLIKRHKGKQREE